MSEQLRRLNDSGVVKFAEWLAEGASGDPPRRLLSDPGTSDTLPARIHPRREPCSDRFAFGEYLTGMLSPLDPQRVSGDRGLWSALAIVWFDQLCPPGAAGNRRVEKEYRYILSADYRHYYRHLVRSPWQLVRDHRQNARFLLLPATDGQHPLRWHGEILEQLGARQAVLRSRPIIREAARLYGDPVTGRPRKGVAGSGAGSARRFGLVLQQFDLTFDPEMLPDGRLAELLPKEFDPWKDSRMVRRSSETAAATVNAET